MSTAKNQPLIGVVNAEDRTLTVISGSPHAQEAYVVVRSNDKTVGYQRLAGYQSREELIEEASAASVDQSRRRPWAAGQGEGHFATVIICTTGTNQLLLRAVAAVLEQQHQDFELIVVDNAPQTGNVRKALSSVDDPRLRIVDEPQAGLSRARNTGVAHARADVVAFTDDDALAHPGWLGALIDVFAADPGRAIGAVTGPVFPAELVTEAQRYFEARGGFPKTLSPTVWALDNLLDQVSIFGDPGEGGPLYPMTTARIGAGVSMAFRRQALSEIGSFDIRLGAGTKARGAEDLDAFARILRLGYAIVTTPDAVMYHTHRADLAGLKAQAYGDGAGMAALLTKSVMQNPATVLTLARRIPAVLHRVAPGSQRMRGSEPGVPPELARQEVCGFLSGPGLFLCTAARQSCGRR
ncbi:glycosyltransferase family 2 protein [Corynebacterium cystitidis]|uniref:glycosyltransferase family 2 protein n=1 Tax=Corynebacterium cystitidis TaxID=35757 RepID=UPI00211DB573|nr:glycosyltransferase family 2 protein [Corynebacterium cystitidis]